MTESAVDAWRRKWMLIIGIAVAGAGIASIFWYVTRRAPVAGEVVLTDGKLVGSFKHERGWFSYNGSFFFVTGVRSHGTGGACLLGGVDNANGSPATCDPKKDATEECSPQFPNSMKGWAAYCAPEGTCWARPFTPVDRDNFNLSAATPTFASCNRSFEPLDPTTGSPWDLNTTYPSNAPMDGKASRHWRVMACVNGVDPANPSEDAGGCSGQQDWGNVLTLK